MLLQVVNLEKKFFDGDNMINVINDVNFSLQKQESIAIVGPSGTGKSALLHILAGLDSPTSGQVLINNNSLFKYSEPQLCEFRNKQLGFIYQNHFLLPSFTVLENVLMPTFIEHGKNNYFVEKAHYLLEHIGLADRMHFDVKKLSGGEKQRVAILRALIHSPALLLADEPTGSLCQYTAELVYDTLLALQTEFATACIVVTHDLKLASKMSKVYHLENGSLIIK